jgi:ribosome-binding protein aMBF1 (putative translation factor)
MFVHSNAMQKTFAQGILSATMGRSGMTDAELAAVLGVNQSTISRLKHGKIAKVAKHQRRLDRHLGLGAGDGADDLSELIALARASPALREALFALQRLMRENA